jgi:hypothetical protein
MTFGEWTRPDGQPLQERDIAELAAALLDSGWPFDKVVESLEIPPERLRAFLQADHEWEEIKLSALGKGEDGLKRKAH